MQGNEDEEQTKALEFYDSVVDKKSGSLPKMIRVNSLQLEESMSREAAHRDTVAALQKELDTRNERLSSASSDVDQLQQQISDLQKLLESEKERAAQVGLCL